MSAQDTAIALTPRGPDRRVKRAGFMIRERRSGFDRRKADGLLYVVSHRPTMMVTALVLLNLLSAADWSLTMHLLPNGAVEGNPIIAGLISINPVVAGVLKIGLVLVVSAGIWTWRRYRSVTAVAVGSVALYSMLIMYELVGLVRIAL